MGRYDDITDETLRAELTRFARLVLRMEDEGVLIDRTHSVLRLLGELRQMVFAHEVRNTVRDEPPRPHPLARKERLERDAAEQANDTRASIEIVREALERERELLEELTREQARDDDEAT